MTIWIDDLREPSGGRAVLSRMLASTPDELTGMMDAIGVDRRFMQRSLVPWVWVTQSQCSKAIYFGAVPVMALVWSARHKQMGRDPATVKRFSELTGLSETVTVPRHMRERKNRRIIGV